MTRIVPIFMTVLLSLSGTAAMAASDSEDAAEANSDIVVLSVAKRGDDSKPVLFSVRVAPGAETPAQPAAPQNPARVALVAPARPDANPAAASRASIVSSANPARGT